MLPFSAQVVHMNRLTTSKYVYQRVELSDGFHSAPAVFEPSSNASAVLHQFCWVYVKQYSIAPFKARENSGTVEIFMIYIEEFDVLPSNNHGVVGHPISIKIPPPQLFVPQSLTPTTAVPTPYGWLIPYPPANTSQHYPPSQYSPTPQRSSHTPQSFNLQPQKCPTATHTHTTK